MSYCESVTIALFHNALLSPCPVNLQMRLLTDLQGTKNRNSTHPPLLQEQNKNKTHVLYLSIWKMYNDNN